MTKKAAAAKADGLSELVESIRPEYERRAIKILGQPAATEAVRANRDRRDGKGSPLSGSHHGDAHADLLLELAVKLTAESLGRTFGDEKEPEADNLD